MNNLPDHVIEALRERELSDDDISRMDAEALFDEYCSWYGIIGFSEMLIEALDSLRGMK